MIILEAGTPVILASYRVDPRTEHVGIGKLRLEFEQMHLGLLRDAFRGAPGGEILVDGVMGGRVSTHEMPRRVIGPAARPFGASFTLERLGSHPRSATRWYLIRDDDPPSHRIMARWPIPLRLAREAAERLALALNTMY